MRQMEGDGVRVVRVLVLTAKNDSASDAESVLVSGTIVKSEAGDRRFEKKRHRGSHGTCDWRCQNNAEEGAAAEIHEIQNPAGQCQFLSVSRSASGEKMSSATTQCSFDARMSDLYEELRDLAGSLNDARVEYALRGGVAMAVHGKVRATIDIELLVPGEAVGQVKAVCRARGFMIEAKPMLLAGGKVPIERLTKASESKRSPSISSA